MPRSGTWEEIESVKSTKSMVDVRMLNGIQVSFQSHEGNNPRTMLLSVHYAEDVKIVGRSPGHYEITYGKTY